MTRVHKPYVPDAWDKVLGIGPLSATLVLRPAGAPQGPKKPYNIAHSKLRIAQREEEDDLMKFCHELWEENGKDFFTFDPDKVRGHLRRSFEKRGGMMIVIGEPGKIEAGALLLLDEYYYTKDFALFELFSYVRPNYRQTPHSKTLVNWAQKQADQLGLLLFIGILSNVRTIAKVRLYRRWLGDPSGAYFVYRPKSGIVPNGPVTGNASTSH